MSSVAILTGKSDLCDPFIRLEKANFSGQRPPKYLGGPLGPLEIIGRPLADNSSFFLTEKDLIFPLVCVKHIHCLICMMLTALLIYYVV